jgi:hypothetical protein
VSNFLQGWSMLYPVLGTIIVWTAILFALRVSLSRWQPPVGARRAITATGVTVAVFSVLAVGLYSGLSQLLSDNSILWTLS